MTDEQIIKNAEYHKLGNCSRCDYKNHGSNCLQELLNDGIKMAKRLCEDVADLEEGYNDGIVCISRYKAENKWLLQKSQQAKSEAIKEFAERLKSRLANLSVQTKTHGRKTTPNYVDDIANQTLHDVVPQEIDNLVKEMTEGKE